MSVYQHSEHPHVKARRTKPPARTADAHVGFNGRLAVLITRAVGNMWAVHIGGFLSASVGPPKELTSQGSPVGIAATGKSQRRRRASVVIWILNLR